VDKPRQERHPERGEDAGNVDHRGNCALGGGGGRMLRFIGAQERGLAHAIQ
jgi:hypothetical protein